MAPQKKASKAAQNFNAWCENELRTVTTCDVQTLISFLNALDNPKDVCEYIQEYLGRSKEVDAKRFAEQYIQRRNQDATLKGSFSPEMWKSGAAQEKVRGGILYPHCWLGEPFFPDSFLCASSF